MIYQGEFAHKIFKEKNISGIALSEAIGCSESHLYNLFKMERIPEKYRTALEVELNFIFPKSEDKDEIIFDENKLELDFKELKNLYSSVLEENKILKEKEVIYLNEIERLKNK